MAARVYLDRYDVSPETLGRIAIAQRAFAAIGVDDHARGSAEIRARIEHSRRIGTEHCEVVAVDLSEPDVDSAIVRAVP